MCMQPLCLTALIEWVNLTPKEKTLKLNRALLQMP
jgi:hypothetical protein